MTTTAARKKGFSKGQQVRYRLVVKAAWLKHCQASGTHPNNKSEYNAWYRQELLDATGCWTTKQLDRTEGFDQAIQHFAIIAGDEFWMNRISEASERRLRYQLKRFLSDLEWLEKEPMSWEYVQGIYTQSRLPLDPDDCPAWMLWKVLQTLDTHIRRICKDYGIRPCELPSRAHPLNKPKTINPEAHHLHVGHDLDNQHH